MNLPSNAADTAIYDQFTEPEIKPMGPLVNEKTLLKNNATETIIKFSLTS